MQDFRHLRNVTEHYGNLQGLKLVPLGVWLFLLGLQLMFGLDRHPVLLVAMLILGILAACLPYLLRHHYARTFGHVLPSEQIRRQGHILGIGGGLFFVAAQWVDHNRPLPISLSVLALGLIALVFWWMTGQWRQHYLVLALLFASVSLASALRFISVEQLASREVTYLVLGMVISVAGILDHRLLSHALPPVREEAE